MTDIKWPYEVKICDVYAEYPTDFMKLLSKFQTMWDGYLGQIKVAQHEMKYRWQKKDQLPLDHTALDQKLARPKKLKSQR